MKNDQYRTQLEEQVKDLIAKYLQTYGEAPAVTIEWGKVVAAAPEPEVVPPDSLRPVIVVLSGLGKKIGKYFKSRDEWAIMYDDSFQFGPLRFGDIVEDWKEID